MNNKAKIKEAQHILTMLENFKADKADEINARVWYVLNGQAYDSESLAHFPNYCTSRDALKAIRLEGWIFGMVQVKSTGLTDYTGYKPEPEMIVRYGRPSPTEEIAELHAILQSYIYEWDLEDG